MAKGRTAVFSTVALWPVHHAETLELVHRAVAEGDEVTLVSCEGDLFACAANRDHKEVLCRICRTQTERTHRRLVPPEVERARLDLARFHQPGLADAIHDRASLLAFTYAGVPIGSYALSQLANEAKDYLVSVEVGSSLDRARQLAINACALYDSVVAFTRDNGITRGYVWNGRRACDGPIFHALKDAGAHAETFITGGFPNSIFTTPHRTIHEGMAALHGWEAPSDLEERAALEREGLEYLEAYRTNRLTVRDFRAFGDSAETVEPDWPLPHDGRQRCLVLMSTVTEVMGMDGTWEFHADAPYSWLEELARERRFIERYAVVVKWHPNQADVGPNEKRHIDETVAGASVFHHLGPSDRSHDAYALTKGAELVLMTGSTVGVWAAANGQCVVSIGPHADRLSFQAMTGFPDVAAYVAELDNPCGHRHSVGAALMAAALGRRGTSMHFAETTAEGNETIVTQITESGVMRRPVTNFWIALLWRKYKANKRLHRFASRWKSRWQRCLRRVHLSLT